MVNSAVNLPSHPSHALYFECTWDCKYAFLPVVVLVVITAIPLACVTVAGATAVFSVSSVLSTVYSKEPWKIGESSATRKSQKAVTGSLFINSVCLASVAGAEIILSVQVLIKASVV